MLCSLKQFAITCCLSAVSRKTKSYLMNCLPRLIRPDQACCAGLGTATPADGKASQLEAGVEETATFSRQRQWQLRARPVDSLEDSTSKVAIALSSPQSKISNRQNSEAMLKNRRSITFHTLQIPACRVVQMDSTKLSLRCAAKHCTACTVHISIILSKELHTLSYTSVQI